jgi:hypothetical protein
MSRYQAYLRRQIEFFEADEGDLAAKAQGRNVKIRLGQVGIRCVHCARAAAGGAAEEEAKEAPSGPGSADPAGSGEDSNRIPGGAEKAGEDRRSRGAVYFPSRVGSLYQAVQNVSNNHFKLGACPSAPESVLRTIEELRRTRPKHSGGKGKRYFSQSAAAVGVVDDDSEEKGIVVRRGSGAAAAGAANDEKPPPSRKKHPPPPPPLPPPPDDAGSSGPVAEV